MLDDRPADLVFLGGRIATMDPARRMAEALAVVDGRIATVGSDSELRRRIGLRTRVVDLRGRTVTPGFGDAHVHPVTSGLDRLRCDLTGARGLAAYLEVIAGYAASHPDEAWIRGSGWSMADFPGGIADGADLDRIVPDRPVYLESRDGHTAWVNRVALARAGITAATPDPWDGRIEHDAEGLPIGTLQEGARVPVFDVLPPDTDEELVVGLRLAQGELHALGITHWQDAQVEATTDIAYTTMADRGELSARVVGALSWDETRGQEQIEELIERRTRTARPRYAPTSVKFFADGILENFTGAVLEPYLDRDGLPTSNLGDSLMEPATFGAAVTRLDALGFQVHVHAIGDRAVRDALDAVEVARRANGPTDTRPQIAHLQLVHPDDLARFRALGVVADVQAYWALLEDQMEQLTIPFVGPERAGRMYPIASLVQAGATIAMGSDWSVSTADPLLQMEVAVERVSDEHRGRRPAFLRDERIGLDDALAGFTRGSAWANHLDGEVGSIEVGKTADLAVLDRDLFDRGAGAIGETRVIATFIDGEAVYERPELGG